MAKHLRLILAGRQLTSLLEKLSSVDVKTTKHSSAFYKNTSEHARMRTLLEKKSQEIYINIPTICHSISVNVCKEDMLPEIQNLLITKETGASRCILMPVWTSNWIATISIQLPKAYEHTTHILADIATGTVPQESTGKEQGINCTMIKALMDSVKT
ncbi:hypothetical protein CISG_09834 [Coccidioides immitis RMSCC 3703]|uniref:Uncharacterized protein n=1 Tax=Coccidioides immitis RMSCC 3703 TaxID=454286 RepID=A0A0J8QLJ1_COCIT|nr:hypothetical protein CISG_09834 [Coccidioides immitis RMSCC 3703]